MSTKLKLAGAVQQHLIPRIPSNLAGLDLAGLYVPCYEVGGDFYDFITLSDQRIILALGDVMGKGPAASLAMASLRASLRAYAEQFQQLDELIRRVNLMFCHDSTLGEFATLFCASIDPDRSTLTYCNCGHEPPILLRDGQVKSLSAGGTVLGLDKHSPYPSHQSALRTGDMLVMYTDGLVDAVNFEREPFGRDRVVQAVVDSADMPAEAAARNILWLMRKFTGLTTRFDDTALVVLRRVPKP